jgi:hypothetical protein
MQQCFGSGSTMILFVTIFEKKDENVFNKRVFNDVAVSSRACNF